MLMTRALLRNGGRHIVNFDEVESFLGSRYDDSMVVFKGRLTLTTGTRNVISDEQRALSNNVTSSPKT